MTGLGGFGQFQDVGSGVTPVVVPVNMVAMEMNWRERITIDPQVLVGKPVIKGTRLAVEFIVDLLAAGWTHEQILDNYPHIRREDIQACLAYAAELLHAEHVVLLQSA